MGDAGAETIVDLGARKLTAHGRLIGVLRAGLLDKAKDVAANADADFALSDVTLLKPVPSPEKIICIGVNYGNRAAEYDNVPDKPAGCPAASSRLRIKMVVVVFPLVPVTATRISGCGSNTRRSVLSS